VTHCAFLLCFLIKFLDCDNFGLGFSVPTCLLKTHFVICKIRYMNYILLKLLFCFLKVPTLQVSRSILVDNFYILLIIPLKQYKSSS
jgi:hypothetical protein